MLRIALVFLMAATLISSQTIILTHNASSYVEGTPAQLMCQFPPIVTKQILQWGNDDNVVTQKLTCVEPDKPCKKKEGYQLTRVGNNITLIIEKLNPLAYTWECTNLDSTLTEIVPLNITPNTPLDLIISKEDLKYKIKSSCSSYPMNISCQLDEEQLVIKDLESSVCANPGLTFYHGVLSLPKSSGTIKCSVERNGKSFVVVFALADNAMYIAGGVLVAIGVAIAVITVIKHFRHICGCGISVLLFGVALLVFNHSQAAFIVFMVFGGIVLLAAIGHKIYDLYFNKTVSIGD